VYGVVRAGGFTSLPDAGVGGAPLDVIEHKGLAAVVSRLPEAELRVRRRDLVSHLRILEHVFERETVVPCAFGAVVSSEQALVGDVLGTRRAELLDLLERLDGRLQMNVKALYDEEEALREVLASEPDVQRQRERVRRLGEAAHFENIRLGELVAEALAARRADDAERVLARLSSEAEDVQLEDAAGDQTIVVKASFLVERGRFERFDAALEELADREAPRLRFESIGPLPPTAFASIRTG
jgi:hypothetical protein